MQRVLGTPLGSINYITRYKLANFMLIHSAFTVLALTFAPKPPENNILKGMCFEPATSDQTARVTAAISSFYGSQYASDFSNAISGNNCSLVSTPGVTGQSDASTIGLDFEATGDLELATAALHELEHWSRASEATPEEADGGDPDTEKGEITTDEWGLIVAIENPCGIFNHCLMAIDDLAKFSALMCGSAEAEKLALCRSWNKDRWSLRVENEITRAAEFGCQPADDFDTDSIPQPPPCCNP